MQAYGLSGRPKFHTHKGVILTKMKFTSEALAESSFSAEEMNEATATNQSLTEATFADESMEN